MFVLQALGVDGKQCLENAKKLKEEFMTQAELKDFLALKKMYPPVPAHLKRKMSSTPSTVATKRANIDSQSRTYQKTSKGNVSGSVKPTDGPVINLTNTDSQVTDATDNTTDVNKTHNINGDSHLSGDRLSQTNANGDKQNATKETVTKTANHARSISTVYSADKAPPPLNSVTNQTSNLVTEKGDDTQSTVLSISTVSERESHPPSTSVGTSSQNKSPSTSGDADARQSKVKSVQKSNKNTKKPTGPKPILKASLTQSQQASKSIPKSTTKITSAQTASQMKNQSKNVSTASELPLKSNPGQEPLKSNPGQVPFKIPPSIKPGQIIKLPPGFKVPLSNGKETTINKNTRVIKLPPGAPIPNLGPNMKIIKLPHGSTEPGGSPQRINLTPKRPEVDSNIRVPQLQSSSSSASKSSSCAVHSANLTQKVDSAPRKTAGGQLLGASNKSRKNPPEPQKIPCEVPLLPPGVKSLEAFAGILLQRKLLLSFSGEMYNIGYYQRRSNQLTKIEDMLKRQTDKPASTTTADCELGKNVSTQSLDFTFPTPNDDENAIVRGNYLVKNKRECKFKPKLNPWRDPLKKLRTTEAFTTLKRRFEGMFSWPALLSTIKPPMKENTFIRKFPEFSNIGQKTWTKVKKVNKFLYFDESFERYLGFSLKHQGI